MLKCCSTGAVPTCDWLCYESDWTSSTKFHQDLLLFNLTLSEGSGHRIVNKTNLCFRRLRWDLWLIKQILDQKKWAKSHAEAVVAIVLSQPPSWKWSAISSGKIKFPAGKANFAWSFEMGIFYMFCLDSNSSVTSQLDPVGWVQQLAFRINQSVSGAISRPECLWLSLKTTKW